MKKIMIVFGTRPEAIKMCPLVKELKNHSEFQVVCCVTGQHRQMLEQVLEAFHIVPEYDLAIMKERQTLFDVTENVLKGMGRGAEKRAAGYCAGAWRHYHHLCYIFGSFLSENYGGACGSRT